MPTDRVTASLGEDAENALDGPIDRTDGGRSEPVRETSGSYAAGFDSANASDGGRPETRYGLLSTGEHASWDVGPLHSLLCRVDGGDGRNEERLDVAGVL
ncbi:MAG: hypothetical protein ACOCPY_00660 [Halorubrum sp.]